MATAAPSATEDKETDFRHFCTLCLEPYWGRTPKLLPCHHTFCLPCLTSLEASVRSTAADTPSDDTGDNKAPRKEQLTHAKSDDEGGETPKPPRQLSEGTSGLDDAPMGSDDVTAGADQDDVAVVSFPCPACRVPVSIPQGGVAGFQTNFYVDHELGPEEDSPDVLCDLCEEDKRQIATHACRQCQRRLCRTCKRCHDVMAPDHHVTPVGLGQPATQERGEKRGGFCLVHRDQPLCLFCRQCDVSICLHCKLTSHDGHPTVDLTSAALQAREEITSSLIPTAQQQVQALDISIQQAARQDRALTRDVQEVTQQIDARHDAVVTWARRSRERLVEEVQAKASRARTQLQGHTSLSTVTRHALSSLLARAARTTAVNPQVLTCRKELKAALLSQDQVLRLHLHPHQQQQQQQPADHQSCSSSSSSSSWGGRYDVTEASMVLREEDIRAYMGRVVEAEGEEGEGGGGEGGRAPCLSLSELSGRLQRLTQETTENAHRLACHIDTCTHTSAGLQQNADHLRERTGDLEKKHEEELGKISGELRKRAVDLEKRLQHEETTSRKAEADLQKDTQSLIERFGKPRQLFEARGLDKDKTKNHHVPMIFQTVVTNEGGHYSGATGVFIAPQTGIYMFTATVRSNKKDEPVYAAFFVDDIKQRTFNGDDKGASDCHVLLLSAGHKVTIKCYSVLDSYDSDVVHNSFTGQFLMALM